MFLSKIGQGRLLIIKLKLDTFMVHTRSQTLPDFTNQFEIIYSFGRELLREEIQNSTSTDDNKDARIQGMKKVQHKLRLMGKHLIFVFYVFFKSSRTPISDLILLFTCCCCCWSIQL